VTPVPVGKNIYLSVRLWTMMCCACYGSTVSGRQRCAFRPGSFQEQERDGAVLSTGTRSFSTNMGENACTLSRLRCRITLCLLDRIQITVLATTVECQVH
jgi:hypothetical protein